MRPIAPFVLICAMTFGCTYNSVEPELKSPEPIPTDLQLADGTALVRLFNSNGDKVFEKIVTARGSAKDGYVNITNEEVNTFLESFAVIWVSVWKQQKSFTEAPQWTIGKEADNADVQLERSWYHISGDWAYEANKGELTIEETTDQKIVGRFVAEALARQNISNPSEWVPNSKWGEKIIIEARFNAKPLGQ